MSRKFLLLIALAMVAIAAVACGSSEKATPTPVVESTLSGTFSIGPLCPVEPCNSTANPYTGHDVVLSEFKGPGTLRVPLGDDGSFSVVGPVGEYSLDLDPCEFLGCSRTLPLRVLITEGAPVTLTIDIDTGIR